MRYAQLVSVFTLRLREGSVPYEMALAHVYSTARRDVASGFIGLHGEPSIEFLDLTKIVRSIHILLPTSTRHYPVVNDLVDGDIYLRLIDVK